MSSLFIMAAGVLRWLVWWTFPPQPRILRILHGTYSPSYSTLRRCQEAICVPFLRVRIVQDWRVRMVRAFAGEGLSPLRQGEIAAVTLLYGNGTLADL